MAKVIKGDLITMALAGEFDVIGHGCNCFCAMKRGIAPQMAEAFGCDSYPLEQISKQGNYDKLGNNDIMGFVLGDGFALLPKEGQPVELWVANMYTQYHWTNNSIYDIPLDYDALLMCIRKLALRFEGTRIGLPWIGCGLAGGDKNLVRRIIEQETQHCDVTIVEYDK